MVPYSSKISTLVFHFDTFDVILVFIWWSLFIYVMDIFHLIAISPRDKGPFTYDVRTEGAQKIPTFCGFSV